MPLPESSNTLIVDCDGVLADKSVAGNYAEADPLTYGISQVNKLYEMGYIIVLYTARYGDREKGNIHLQYERGYKEWTDWLEKHGVNYHHAFMGKPAGAIYIDDKAARVEEDSQEGWGQVWKEVHNLKGRDRYGNKL
jgi:hypothetical protein